MWKDPCVRFGQTHAWVGNLEHCTSWAFASAETEHASACHTYVRFTVPNLQNPNLSLQCFNGNERRESGHYDLRWKHCQQGYVHKMLINIQGIFYELIYKSLLFHEYNNCFIHMWGTWNVSMPHLISCSQLHLSHCDFGLQHHFYAMLQRQEHLRGHYPHQKTRFLSAN